MSDGRNKSEADRRQKEKRLKEMEKTGEAHSAWGVTGALHSTHEAPPRDRRRRTDDDRTDNERADNERAGDEED